MALVKFERGLEIDLPDGLSEDGHIYISTDNGNMYLGLSDGTMLPIAKKAQILFDQSGASDNRHKVYYNGQDVTNNPDAYKFAKSHWHGSWEAYKELRDANPSLIEQDVAYHIKAQTDWNENDPKSLAYLKNKPNIMDMEVEDTTANFFYK